MLRIEHSILYAVTIVCLSSCGGGSPADYKEAADPSPTDLEHVKKQDFRQTRSTNQATSNIELEPQQDDAAVSVDTEQAEYQGDRTGLVVFHFHVQSGKVTNLVADLTSFPVSWNLQSGGACAVVDSTTTCDLTVAHVTQVIKNNTHDNLQIKFQYTAPDGSVKNETASVMF